MVEVVRVRVFYHWADLQFPVDSNDLHNERWNSIHPGVKEGVVKGLLLDRSRLVNARKYLSSRRRDSSCYLLASMFLDRLFLGRLSLSDARSVKKKFLCKKEEAMDQGIEVELERRGH